MGVYFNLSDAVARRHQPHDRVFDARGRIRSRVPVSRPGLFYVGCGSEVLYYLGSRCEAVLRAGATYVVSSVLAAWVF